MPHHSSLRINKTVNAVVRRPIVRDDTGTTVSRQSFGIVWFRARPGSRAVGRLTLEVLSG
jgi:hypothetical protein